MKVLCDVHISFRVVSFLNENGIEAIHVNNVLSGSTSKDSAICAFADENGFAVLTKDADFRERIF
jgi:predicted nuclease of predicted toxin-antitoxin system